MTARQVMRLCKRSRRVNLWLTHRLPFLKHTLGKWVSVFEGSMIVKIMFTTSSYGKGCKNNKDYENVS
jgi:hypothetical protein